MVQNPNVKDFENPSYLEEVKEVLYTFVISRDGEEKARLEHQKNDHTMLGKMHSLQSNSLDRALKYEGWKIEVINENTRESEFMKHYSR